ncbi:hypothetical protein VNO77_44255 [Canavalia gladiata]|uniref:Uncharacterized protein n=1 Tax=Canavalia gladiata TaxID=3824 RepID=A0AAN9JVP9_CANGL
MPSTWLPSHPFGQARDPAAVLTTRYGASHHPKRNQLVMNYGGRTSFKGVNLRIGALPSLPERVVLPSTQRMLPRGTYDMEGPRGRVPESCQDCTPMAGFVTSWRHITCDPAPGCWRILFEQIYF